MIRQNFRISCLVIGISLFIYVGINLYWILK